MTSAMQKTAGLAVNALARRSAPASIAKPPPYGLSMWFKVTVESSGVALTLGSWSGCSGLGVRFRLDEFRQGGQYEFAEHFPGEVSYGEITLERAIEPKGSDELQRWLRLVLAKWINSADGGSGFEGARVVIELFSSYNQTPVYTWTLRGAVPVAWTGPNLSAKSGDIAIERLTLAHKGFLDPESDDKLSPADQPGQGKVTLSKQGVAVANQERLRTPPDKLDHSAEKIVFRYTPAQITFNKTIPFDRSKRIAQNVADQVVDPGKLAYNIGSLRLEGVDEVADAVAKLCLWIDDDWAVVEQGKEAKQRGAQVLRLTIGAGTGAVIKLVCLRSVSVTYTRFTSAGVPSRATVSVTLEEYVDRTKLEAKESGSAVATVTGGQSLQSIANDSKAGGTGDYRKLAEANGIDDARRVPSGSAVRVPAP